MCVLMFLSESSRVVDLRVSSQSSDSLLLAWQHPTQSNGPVEIYLMRYRLTRVGDCPTLDPPGRWSRLLDIDNNQLQAVINDLLPYSRYQVKIWARTAAGRGQVAIAYATTAAAGLCSFTEWPQTWRTWNTLNMENSGNSRGILCNLREKL